MPERSWLCGQCGEQNPPFTEVCRNCYEPFLPEAERSASRLATVRYFNPLGTVTLPGKELIRYVGGINRLLTALSLFALIAVPLVIALILAAFPQMYAQIYSFTGAAFWLSYRAGLAAGLLGLGCSAGLDLYALKHQVGNDGSGMKALVRMYFTVETSFSRKVLIVLTLVGLLMFTAIYSLMVGLLLAKNFIL
jgi:hypothetical protein